MLRLFAEPQDITAKTIKLSAEDLEHIRSLRLRPDELFVICDGEGTDYICRPGSRKEDTAAEIIRECPSLGEPTVKCTVYIAYAKGERLDYAVQKSVELGAQGIVLFKSNRCVAVPNIIQKKTARLQRIALETAKQCGRGLVPVVTAGGEFETAVEMAAGRSELSLLCYEGEDFLHLKKVLEQHFPPLPGQEAHTVKSVSIITGPEGGFESDEVKLAQSKGIHIVSLGPRILRSETAPVIALSAIMFHTGNL